MQAKLWRYFVTFYPPQMNITEDELRELVQLATDYRGLYSDQLRRDGVQPPKDWRKQWYFLNDQRARLGMDLIHPESYPQKPSLWLVNTVGNWWTKRSWGTYEIKPITDLPGWEEIGIQAHKGPWSLVYSPAEGHGHGELEIKPFDSIDEAKAFCEAENSPNNFDWKNALENMHEGGAAYVEEMRTGA